MSKLILLTGANSGIGLEASKSLCQLGHKVVVTVRSAEKGEQTLADVKDEVPNADISYLLCEMSDPDSVRNLAAEFKEKHLSEGQLLDVLINNAGCALAYSYRVMCEKNPEWEKTFAVNAIGPILLIDLLMDDLKATAAAKGEARIVMVSSSITNKFDSMYPYQTDLDDVMIAKPGVYKDGQQAYKNSKVAFNQAGLAIADEIDDSGIKLNFICPGVIPGTNLATKYVEDSQRSKLKCLICCMGCLMGQSNKTGGKYIVQVAEGERGKSQGLFYYRGKVIAQAPQCADKAKQKRMLEILRELPK